MNTAEKPLEPRHIATQPVRTPHLGALRETMALYSRPSVLPSRASRPLLLLALCCSLLAGTPLQAFAGDDADAHDETGPRLFGFVRDTDGKALANARITVAVKGFGSLVARSNATGAYRVPIPGLGTKLGPPDVGVTCDREGYKQQRVLVRTPPGRKPVTALEIDCRMQAIKGK